MPKDTPDTRVTFAGEHLSTPLVNQFCQIELAAITPLAASAAVTECWSDLFETFTGFIARRMREDNRTLHAMLHCHEPSTLHDVQSRAFQTFLNDWQEYGARMVSLTQRAAVAALGALHGCPAGESEV